jgi:hypothetical protein
MCKREREAQAGADRARFRECRKSDLVQAHDTEEEEGQGRVAAGSIYSVPWVQVVNEPLPALIAIAIVRGDVPPRSGSFHKGNSIDDVGYLFPLVAVLLHPLQ